MNKKEEDKATEITIRAFQEEDAEEVAQLLGRNFMEVNIKDYGPCAMVDMRWSHNAAWVSGIASSAHMYVFCDGVRIVGCGSIASFWGSLEESIILTVFVLPEYHHQGIGRRIMAVLEEDDFFLRAKRIEIPASITALDFYRKLGYDYKNGKDELDEEGHYRLEKWRVV